MSKKLDAIGYIVQRIIEDIEDSIEYCPKGVQKNVIRIILKKINYTEVETRILYAGKKVRGLPPKRDDIISMYEKLKTQNIEKRVMYETISRNCETSLAYVQNVLSAHRRGITGKRRGK